MIIDYIGWVITAVAIVGTIGNVYKKNWCFILWIVSNLYWMFIDITYGLYSQAFLFFVYFALSIFGLYKWTTKR